MYGRLPIVKMLLVTIALTVVQSAIMVPINWDGQQGSTAAAPIDNHPSSVLSITCSASMRVTSTSTSTPCGDPLKTDTSPSGPTGTTAWFGETSPGAKFTVDAPGSGDPPGWTVRKP